MKYYIGDSRVTTELIIAFLRALRRTEAIQEEVPPYSFGQYTPVDTAGIPVEINNGTYGEFKVVGGILYPATFPLTPGIANVSGYSVQVISDRRTVGNLAEFDAVCGPSASTPSYGGVQLRPGDYSISNWQNYFKFVSNNFVIEAAMNNAHPKLTKGIRFNISDTSIHKAGFRFSNVDFHLDQPVSDYQPATMVQTDAGYIVNLARCHNFIFDGCNVTSNMMSATTGHDRI
jgi:hypothetical protein